jgi:hypothetical protein
MILQPKTVAFSGVALLTATALLLLSFSRVDYRVNLESVLSIWGDVVRDVDQVGLTLTRMSVEKEMEIGQGIAQQIASRRSMGAGGRYVAEVGQRMMPYLQREGRPCLCHHRDAGFRPERGGAGCRHRS